jgi:hypothetical protein
MSLRVATVTAYHGECIDFLRQCHDSVAAQTYPTTHFMVADGAPQMEIGGWAAEHIILPRSHADFGDTPRVVGALSALNLGYDAITFLDADNWYHRKHVEVMVAAHEHTKRSVCLASRSFHRLDGSFMYDCKEDDGHADTSCLFLAGEVTRLIPLMAMKPRPLAEVGDRVFWKCIIARDIPFVRITDPTVAYRSAWKVHYEAMGETPPEGTKEAVGNRAYEWLETATEEEKVSWSRFLFGGENRW